MIENLEIFFFQNNFRKCHTTLRVFPKRDGLTPSESLDAGLCTRTLSHREPDPEPPMETLTLPAMKIHCDCYG